MTFLKMVHVYRICLAKYADKLVASGSSNRWNSRGNYVIYAAASRSLACLENVVHRSGEGLNQLFKTVVIRIPDGVAIEEIEIDRLPLDWFKKSNYPSCQALGDEWYNRGESVVLKVPSSIINKEFVYVLNTRHPDFAKIQIIDREEFDFDPRIKYPDPENM